MKSIEIKEVIEILKTKDNIKILTHRSPDADTLGSAFALYYALRDMNKNAQIICSDPFPDKYEYMYGDGSFKNELAKTDYIISVDLATPDLMGSLKEEYKDKVDLCIDHHVSNTFYAKKTYLKENSSNCENIFEIFEVMDLPLTKEIAKALFSGILTDTGRFLHSSEVATHMAVAKLLKTGIDGYDINQRLFGTNTMEAIMAIKEIYKTLEFAHDGRVAIAYLDSEFFKNTDIDNSELDGLSSIPVQIEGVDIGITIRERDKNVLRVSIRTTDKASAGDLGAVFGGGGHPRAAGALIMDELEKGKKLLLKAAEEELLRQS